MAVTWTDDHTFTLDGVTFRSMTGGDGDLVALKPRSLVDLYEQVVADLRPRRILELGVYGGGSVAFLAMLAQPERLAAVDRQAGCDPLDRFMAEHRLPVEVFYGVDQSDADALERIVGTFDGPLDLVIDDASHLEGPTLASFNRLFPHLRPGGLYVIEDWLSLDGPMTELVCDLVRASVHIPRAIARVTVDHDWVTVRRGDAEMTPGRFDVRNHLRSAPA